MASLSTQANGHRLIRFMDAGGRRRTIRLGKTSQRNAAIIKGRIEQIIAAQRGGLALDAETAAWLGDVDDRLRGRLAATGLVQLDGTRDLPTLREFLERYRDLRTDIKPRTRINYQQAIDNLLRYFGDKRLDQVTAGDADEFRLSLLERLGDNTVRRHCGRAKQFFKAAVRKGFITRNPFADMKSCNVRENRARDYTVTLAQTAKVIEACPDAEWRLIVALCRYGGLRCPSEVFALEWPDVLWDKARMVITSPKTEHHEGKDSRVVPIFPELRPHLEAAFEEAAEGAVHVIARHRNANLRTRFAKIIRRAGLAPWPKLFHNLRASRETELAAAFPMHVVCDWIGNSELVATKHYLRTTEADFERAAQPAGNLLPPGCALQKAGQQDAATGRSESRDEKRKPQKPQDLRGVAAPCGSVQFCPVPPRGLDSLPESPEKTQVLESALQKAGHLQQDDLGQVLDAWPELPPAIRAAVLALVDAATVRQ